MNYIMKNTLIETCLTIIVLLSIMNSASIPLTEGNNTINFNEKRNEKQLAFDNFHSNRKLIIDYSLYSEKQKTSIKSFKTIERSIMASHWPMKCHDLHHTGQSLYNTPDGILIEKWKFTCDKVEGGSAINDQGVIYFGDFDNILYALYPNGTLKWDFDLGPFGWVYSCPVIGEDGTIYVTSYDDYLHAVNPNGTEKWKFCAYDSITSSPAIAKDGTIYFGSMGPGDDGRIFAVYPNGTKKWHYDAGYWITSDPAVGDDGTIYIGSGDTYLYALYPNGTLRWRFKTDSYVKGPPSIANDGTIYVGSWDGFLYAVFLNGTEKWKCAIGGGAETNPSIASDGTIYIGYDALYAVYPNGTIRWTFNLGSNRIIHQSSPAISADGKIYIGTKIGESDGGEIIIINPDGSENWRSDIIANDWVDTSPSIAEDGTIYIGSTSNDDGYSYGYLHAFGRKELEASAHGPYIGIINESIHFIGSAYGGYPPYTWLWDFDDNTSTLQNPTHTYTAPGNYTVTLTVTDDHGNTSNDTTWAKIKEVNDPPNNPDCPEGNIYGKINTEYMYSTSTTDSDPDDLIYYMFDWGDGNFSAWVGPYHSGAMCTLSHTWTEKGIYEIRVKAKDNYDYENNWSDPLEIYRTELTLNLRGNFLSITAEIENTGDYQLDDVYWSFSVTGGILERINEQQSGTIPVLPAGEKETITSGLIFGLGFITITITAVDESKTANGLVIGPFYFY